MGLVATSQKENTLTVIFYLLVAVFVLAIPDTRYEFILILGFYYLYEIRFTRYEEGRG